jgi:hypothetical protein
VPGKARYRSVEAFAALFVLQASLQLTSHSHTLPPSVRTTQQLKIARSTIAQLTQQTFRLRKELDDLHTSSAAHYFDLEERLATHVARYDELSEQHHQLALKYDHILNIMVNMCEKLDVHAEKLVELDDWRGMQPQIMNFGYPSPMHTVDIVHETADILLGMREQGVEPMSTPSPPSTPSASAESAKECRLVLRLPLRPAVDKGETERADSVYGSSGEKGKMDVKLVSKKRVRKRKSVDDGPTRIVKRAKKCHV